MRGPYKTRPEPGSFADLIIRYRRSPRVLAWRPATLAQNDAVLADFMAENGRLMVAELRRGDIIAMRDSMATTPGAANNWLKVIRGLLGYAVDLEMIAHNPADRVPGLKMKHADGIRTWRDDEIEAFLAHWPRGSQPHLVLTLALCTGAARGDLVSLGWANVSADGRLRYRRKKTGAAVDIPILPALAETLAQVPRTRMTFLETERGTVRSPNGLHIAFLRWCEQAGLGDVDESGHRLSLHGLRKAAARRAAEAGASPFDMMGFFGWEDIGQAQAYARKFDRARGADKVAALLGEREPGNVTRLRKKTVD